METNKAILAAIARQYLFIGTLDSRKSGRRTFMRPLVAIQDAEELGGPEESDSMNLQVAVIREAPERISCYASYAVEE